jgi:RHS repeat-associated protein
MKYIIKTNNWTKRETEYDYDGAGRLIRTIRPNGTVRAQLYDPAGQIRFIEERDSANTLLWMRACKYDSNGNIVETITSPTETTNWTLPADTLAYDNDNRLATWNGFTVTHDADGNMINGPLPGGTGAVHTYDMFDRLVGAGGVTSTYNPDGLRVSAGGISYVVDPNGALSKPLVRQQGGTATKYVWGLGLIYEQTGGNIKTYHADHLGSTVALTNASGAVIDRWEYSSYGTQTYRTGTSDTPFQFHGLLGCMTDANGLVYMRARYYNPRLMRFINADPIGFGGGLNWYAFVGNNPMGFVDPSGLMHDYEMQWALEAAPVFIDAHRRANISKNALAIAQWFINTPGAYYHIPPRRNRSMLLDPHERRAQWVKEIPFESSNANFLLRWAARTQVNAMLDNSLPSLELSDGVHNDLEFNNQATRGQWRYSQITNSRAYVNVSRGESLANAFAAAHQSYNDVQGFMNKFAFKVTKNGEFKVMDVSSANRLSGIEKYDGTFLNRDLGVGLIINELLKYGIPIPANLKKLAGLSDKEL